MFSDLDRPLGSNYSLQVSCGRASASRKGRAAEELGSLSRCPSHGAGHGVGAVFSSCSQTPKGSLGKGVSSEVVA